DAERSAEQLIAREGRQPERPATHARPVETQGLSQRAARLEDLPGTRMRTSDAVEPICMHSTIGRDGVAVLVQEIHVIRRHVLMTEPAVRRRDPAQRFGADGDGSALEQAEAEVPVLGATELF